MRMLSRFIIWQLAVMLWAGTAEAGKAEAQAAKFFEQGRAHFEAGRFDEALNAFNEAYNLTAEPKLLFNLAACAEGLGDKERAKAYYQVYLEELPDAEDAAEVRARIESLSKEPAPSTEPPTSAESEPAPEEAVVKTPEPVVDAAEFYKKPKETKRRGPIWPTVTIGVGGMTVAAGVITAILAKTRYDGLESSCSPECSDDQVKKAKGPAVAADVLFGLGGAAVVAGVVGLVLQKTKQKEKKIALSPITGVGAGGGLVGLEGSF